MLNYIKSSSSIRVGGVLRLCVRELAQRDDGQWFLRVDKSAWQAVSVELIHEVQPHFWTLRINSKILDGSHRLLPVSVFPKVRLPK